MFNCLKALLVLLPIATACGQRSAPKVEIVKRNPDKITTGGESTAKQPEKPVVQDQEPAQIGLPGDQDGSSTEQQQNPSPEQKPTSGVNFESGVYQLFYDFKSLGKKDCLVANSSSQITVAPCSESEAMGFTFKKIESQSYNIIAKSTGKCLQVDTKNDYKNQKGQAIIQVPCANLSGDAGQFNIDSSKDITKIKVMSLCLKLGMSSNVYLDQCDISWTWFSNRKI